jgi:predicted GIY-YIG superfamily endonuclease
MYCTDPDPGIIYLIHFDLPYKHARHYTGWTTDLDARLHAHRQGRGARLMEVITNAGITWRLVRTWLGGRDRERAIKNRHEAPRLCPECSAPPFPVSTGRAAPHAVTAHYLVPVGPPQPRISPYQRGLRNGQQFIADRPGWPAARLTATYLSITGPFRAKPRYTAAELEWFRGYTAPILHHVLQIRAAEPGLMPRSDGAHGVLVGGGTR